VARRRSGAPGPLNVRVLFSPGYDFSLLGLERLHPFDAHKYGRAWALVEKELGPALDSIAMEPKQPASDELLMLVHTREYLESLRSSETVARALELWPLRLVPNSLLQGAVLKPMRLAVQGTVMAAEMALQGAMVMNFGGGFHHAFRDRGEGFCLFADVAIAIAAQRAAGRLAADDRILVIDLDAHRGNGFEEIARSDPAVRVFDVYNAQAYPGLLPDWDPEEQPFMIPVLPGAGDSSYGKILAEDFPKFLDGAGQVRLAFYNAGTDIVAGDRIGGLDVSPEGVAARDRLVLDTLARRNIPTVIVTSGGYTRASHALIARMALHLARNIPADG
jgi:histone deacetylase 11